MASLQETTQRALGHLRSMTLSQKAAVFLGAVLVGASLLWMVQWSSRSELTPLLTQSLAPDELARMQTGLSAIGQTYRVSGSQILVPASADRSVLLAQLQQSGQMPADTSLGFAELVKEANPWISNQESDRRWTVALKGELERVLKAFAGVRDAKVFLNLSAPARSFSRNAPESTASVTLILASGESVSRNLALAAARLVSGAVRGLPLRNVQIVDGSGRPALDWDDESSDSGSGLLRLARDIERSTARKISSQLGFDSAVLVNVFCELEHKSERTDSVKTEDGAAIQRSEVESETRNNRAAGQPGVQPNVGVAVNAGAAADQTTRSTTLDIRMQPSTTTRSEVAPAGQIRRLSAAINLPYSFLARVYALNNPDAPAPIEKDIEALFATYKTRVAAHVAKLLVPPEEEQVAVDWYYDALQPPATAPAAGAAETGLDLARRFGPGAGLVGLALISLLLLLRMARRGGASDTLGLELGLPQEAIDAARRAAADLKTVAGEPASAGAAGTHVPRSAAAAGGPSAGQPAGIPTGLAADSVLEAQEIDEDTIAVSGMIEQITRRVSEDSAAVAGLVETWIQGPRR